jgi:integrase/recombinase XerD
LRTEVANIGKSHLTGVRTDIETIFILWLQKKPVFVYQFCTDIIRTGLSKPEAARMKTQVTFSQAVEGYLLAAHARHLSQNTLQEYTNTYRKFLAYSDSDPPIKKITTHQVESFLANQPVSKKTILNYHTGLSALWTWAVNEDLVDRNILHKIRRPKPEKRSIVPYTQADIKMMLGALSQSRIYTRPGRKESSHAILHPERNRAIILLLLDTGIRASELCNLQINHVDLQNQRLTVLGKGSKERTIPFSSRTGQAIWRYLTQRKKDTTGDPLFVTIHGRHVTRDQILKAIQRIGKRVGIEGVNLHRFRHTFAINFLRNGGDPWSLQMILGHSTMEMVKTYLALAQADLEKSHQIASPVDNWRL